MLELYLSLIENEEDKIKITEIYEQYLDWMLKIAFHYLRDEKDAEDAVSDVFLSIASTNCNIPTSSCNETKSYLFICVRNSAFHISSSKNKIKTVDIDELFNLSSETNIEDEMIKKINYEYIRKVIDEFPPKYKDILILHINFGKTIREISQELHIPFKTVETRLCRCKSILRKRIGNIDI